MRTGIGLFHDLSLVVGVPEAGLRLLTSVLIGYPLAFVYRKYLYGKEAHLQHAFFAFTGFAIGYFNFGATILHSIICILVEYFILLFAGGTKFSVAAAFIFQLGYLLGGYAIIATDSYDIMWTMPHCVLTLKLIGLAFDLYDGHKKEETLSPEQKDTCIKESPGFVEIFGYSYFVGAFLVGPQFPLRKFRNLVEGKNPIDDSSVSPSCVSLGLQKFALGLFYCTVYSVGSMYIPGDIISTQEYSEYPFWMRLAILAFWCRIYMYKYILCWLFAEGVCMITGLSYKGKNKDGKHDWSGCQQVLVPLYETSQGCGDIIRSFNLTTNHWAAYYIYKRLAFLGNKLVSQAACLAFLAVWHGFHAGYYCAFILEFMVMKMENDVVFIFKKSPNLSQILSNPAVNLVKRIICHIYTWLCFGYCVSSFSLLTAQKSMKLYGEVYYFWHIFFLSWMIGYPIIKNFLRSPKSSKSANGKVTENGGEIVGEKKVN